MFKLGNIRQIQADLICMIATIYTFLVFKENTRLYWVALQTSCCNGAHLGHLGLTSKIFRHENDNKLFCSIVGTKDGYFQSSTLLVS